MEGKWLINTLVRTPPIAVGGVFYTTWSAAAILLPADAMKSEE
jgi:hypothetical protein